jgi:hypothetical protein
MNQAPASLTIEHDVPVPNPPGWAAPLLRQMQPGDSCVLENGRKLNTLRTSAGRMGCKVTARAVPKGFRFWLLARKAKEAAR